VVHKAAAATAEKEKEAAPKVPVSANANRRWSYGTVIQLRELYFLMFKLS
jgi:hypothetical protein